MTEFEILVGLFGGLMLGIFIAVSQMNFETIEMKDSEE